MLGFPGAVSMAMMQAERGVGWWGEKGREGTGEDALQVQPQCKWATRPHKTNK